MPDGPGLPWEPPSTYAMRSDIFISKTHNEADGVAPSRDSFGSGAPADKSRFGAGFCGKLCGKDGRRILTAFSAAFYAAWRILALREKNLRLHKSRALTFTVS